MTSIPDDGARILALDLVDDRSAWIAIDGSGEVVPSPDGLPGGDVTSFYLGETGRPWTGASARRRSLEDPAHGTLRPFGAFLGPCPVDGVAPLDPFARAREGAEGTGFAMRGRHHRVATVLTLLFRAAREDAVEHLGALPEELALTHPGWLGARRREDLARIARAAGFEGVTLMDRGTAAAIALEAEGLRGRVGILRVERCGIDAAITEIDDSAVEMLRIAASPVGAALDPVQGLVRHLVDGFVARNDGAVVLRGAALARVQEAARTGLDAMVGGERMVPVSLPYVDEGASRSPHLMDRLDRTVLERSCEGYVDGLRRVLAEVVGEDTSVDRWVLCGHLAGLDPVQEALRGAVSEEVVVRGRQERLSLSGMALEASRRAEGGADAIFLLASAPHELGVRSRETAPIEKVIDRFESLPTRTQVSLEVPSGAHRVQVDLVEGESARQTEAYQPVSFELGVADGRTTVDLVLEVAADGTPRLGAVEDDPGRCRYLERAETDDERESAGVSEGLSDGATALRRLVERELLLVEARSSRAAAVDALGREESQPARGSDRARRAEIATVTGRARSALAGADPEAIRDAERQVERLGSARSR